MKLGQVLPRTRTDLPAPKIANLTFLKAKGKFKNLKKLGAGAFGVTYSGTLGSHRVIIKVACGAPGIVTPPQAIDAMKREVRILGRLQKYPFIPRVFEVGIDYFVMEDVEGISFLDLLSKNGLSAKDVLSVVVATGIIASVLHRNEVAHNDLEPRNILLTPQGVVVIDFGISLTPEDGRKEFLAARERDIVSLLEILVLMIGSSEVPSSIKIILTSTVEQYRKIVFSGKVDEDTARELARELIFALAQMGARAHRGKKKLPVDQVKVIAV